MKYAIVIPDGCADESQESLGGKTPLQAACKPNMDRIAQTGVVGRSNNVPASLTPASDVATLSLFGYDPLAVYTGRAPLEAAALGVTLGPGDWAVRCNLVHVTDGEVLEHSPAPARFCGHSDDPFRAPDVDGAGLDAELVQDGAGVRTEGWDIVHDRIGSLDACRRNQSSDGASLRSDLAPAGARAELRMGDEIGH